GSPQDALFAVVIFINVIIGVSVEIKAKKALDKLSILVVSKVRVLRNKTIIEKKSDFSNKDLCQIDIDNVKVGDIVYLSSGDQVPVDALILKVQGLEVDESMLTGESDSVKKQIGDSVLSGSIVIAGSAWIKTIAVGQDSYVQKITTVAKVYKPIRSDLVNGINKILKYISFGILPIAVLLFYSQVREYGSLMTVLANGQWRTAIIQATAGIVGMIPEGLVLLTSFNFALAAIILSKKQVIIQEPPAVEALARVDTLCLDKTGTLTDGKTIVENIEFSNKGIDKNQSLLALSKIIKSTTKNNTALAIESFLKKKCKAIFNQAKLINSENLVEFSSQRKYSGAKIDNKLWLLGAPEFVGLKNGLQKSSYDKYLNQGKRLLVLTQNNQIYLTIICSENVRKGAQKTIEYFYLQGVNPIIISGDNPQAVAAIARSVGMKNIVEYNAQNLPSNISDLQKIVVKYNIFGRVLPEQKKILIRAFQRNGQVVAMTGDGVNDVLALKESDLSIVMSNGASAAKSISHIVLANSSFEALPSVLGQGRRVMANMERVTSLFLTKTFSSIFLVLAAVITFEPYPLLPRHLTIISALTIGIPSFFLALPANNIKYVKGFLHRVIRFSLPAGFILSLGVFISFTVGLNFVAKQIASTYSVIVALIIAFIILALRCRPLKSWRLILLFGLIILAIAAFLIPVCQTFFKLYL
ncbi:MAG: HAD-IC family P-type ATPase, partial [Bifidobacteriaceae bacterium]|nr:HAD-IC family P-type ATPase [Bifidobacteriaceae bacterium]